MSSRLSTSLADPEALLSACKMALPSWSGAALENFTTTKLTMGYSSPGLYRVSCNLPGVNPARAVVKLEVESSEHPFLDFYKALASSGGPYQARVARQLGEAGLGPVLFYIEQDMASPYWGLMVMEELTDGGFEKDFDSITVTGEDMKAMGFLLGKLHSLPTEEVEKAAKLAQKLVLEHGMGKMEVEELYQSRGGYAIFLIHWWKTLFPLWMADQSPQNYPLPQIYTDRFLNLILKMGRIKPLTSVMSKLGVSHSDVWHGNLMRKGEKIVAIDCETASIGPAFLDFGGILWNSSTVSGKQPHLERGLREAMALSFYQSVEENCDNIDDVLYDIELGFIHRHLWIFLVLQFGLVSKPLSIVEKIGGLLMEKIELMINGMERAVEDTEVMKDVVNNGIYWTIRDQLSEGSEITLEKHFSGDKSKEDE